MVPELVPSRESLQARYYRRIGRHITAVLGADDERDDLVHEVLMTVFSRIDTLRDPACMDGWVAQITMNTLRCALRQRRRHRHASLTWLEEGDLPAIQASVDVRETATRALEVLHRLPQGERELLSAHWFSPLGAEGIASEAGCSARTVRRRLSRAQRRFAKIASQDPALAPCLDQARRRFRPARTGTSAAGLTQ